MDLFSKLFVFTGGNVLFLETIFISINTCSKSTKGSSRELMLFTMHKKRMFTHHDQTKQKTNTKYRKLAEMVGHTETTYRKC